jgi:undecaprenyl-diphosphatase
MSAHRAGNVPERPGDRGEAIGRRLGWPPLLCTAGVLVAGYAIVVLTMCALGLLLTHVLLHGRVGDWDTGATGWVADHRGPWLDHASGILSRSADTLGVVAVAAIVIVVLALHRRWRFIAVLVAALVLELSVFLLVNVVVDRPRPDVVKLGSTPSTSSFPSGHSAATVVLYLCIALFVRWTTDRRAVRIVAVVVAVLAPLAVGSARAYRGMHHPLDVAFGYGMGVAVVMVAILAVSAGYGHPARTSHEHPSLQVRGGGADQSIGEDDVVGSVR